jgi:acetyltransferase-like isoleucine patch superfamily enzyme
VIGPHVHLGPGVNLCGAVEVGEGTLVGVGACAIPCSRIGEWSIVGAGSAVTADVPPRTTVGGVPARPLARREERA